MTEMDIIKRLARTIDDRKFPFQLSNAFIYKWECDFWTMTGHGETREFEIKISRSDYFHDAKKDKHKSTDGANYFYYVTPFDLIKPDEVEKRYGLIYVSEDAVLIKKKPQRLNNNEFGLWKMLATKMYWKFHSLWRQKYMNKEINYQEYAEGFNTDLLEHAPSVQP